MRKLKEYDIGYKGLKDGNHTFDYSIDADFFALFENSLYENAQVEAHIDLKKDQQMMILDFDFSGSVTSVCDNCLESVEIPIDYQTKLYVKFGEVYDEPSEEIIVLPREEHELNVAQMMYDLVVTSMPIRHLHPFDEDGNRVCDPDMVQKLSEYLVDSAPESDEENDSDPRWDELKKLIDKHK
ncbi:YceD family protein [Geofilum rubicundum]|uniref:Ribosomal protein L32p n=1 Tax=Geofilum rubicundum JCM 15548 TaxID=1236989 RepID=A0A0E9LVP9_9BACT|nr:DUF177 domain-containing protein [Geofilum rubicundum]GAO29368.1 ribosomal protein L32p [Geofilum rubicundum JCM 15548]